MTPQEHVEKHFDRRKDIEKVLDKSKKTVAFISYYPTYRNQYADLYNVLKNDFNVIKIVSVEQNDKFEKNDTDGTFYIPWRANVNIGNGQTKDFYPEYDYEFIDFIITADGVGYLDGKIDNEFLSKKAKRIYLSHDVINGCLVKGSNVHVFMPSKTAAQRKDLDGYNIIEGGYPKLDYTIDKYNEISKNTNEDSILYAPTLRHIENNHKVLNTAVGVDYFILKALLDNFGEKIIFRPHPFHLKNGHPIIKPILDKFSYSNRLIISDDNYLEDYAKSKFMVTDTSTTAFTYSMSTLKPIIAVHPFLEQTIYSSHFSSIGKVVTNMKDMITAGNDFIENSAGYLKSIEEYRKDNIFNIGKSQQYILELLKSWA
jgi:hypothetical protein